MTTTKKATKKTVAKKTETETRIETRNLRVNLTTTEQIEAGQELSRLFAKRNQQEEDKKRVNDDHKARISETEAQISAAAGRVRDGYDFRDVPCTVTIGEPKGRKTIRRNDSGEVLGVFDLEADEAQKVLPFVVKADAPIMVPGYLGIGTPEAGSTNVGEVMDAGATAEARVDKVHKKFASAKAPKTAKTKGPKTKGPSELERDLENG